MAIETPNESSHTASEEEVKKVRAQQNGRNVEEIRTPTEEELAVMRRRNAPRAVDLRNRDAEYRRQKELAARELQERLGGNRPSQRTLNKVVKRPGTR